MDNCSTTPNDARHKLVQVGGDQLRRVAVTVVKWDIKSMKRWLDMLYKATEEKWTGMGRASKGWLHF
ncbi:hypothetical protein NECAME_07966 [Necator americanus]|uniref:Uncharacterized protein n=1 Tax=Necator americanus TaxID=51031 RepID=W2TKX0_NECAM|nr:hypothetical protein NECAME_07966 [Necator americanus]ETN82438.1 hypothetical protein NECAME_07966 [Necator americanus]